ncbi:aminotransferase class I/II-fold pyridoxal phosphate-dependent enzyme [Oceanobacillus sp. J11TS1]|uniref:aminotransferase class I/II-fold pyridoxal phosphate-dependent enzyme n=1 Tax=Oceanobacillus sp. J11TS1 TaxID=2807191 RepID=UPI001B042957|nr:aminotransferase class I/II-fold pyridoxal phosphate-dependent enzyme [Oceanobacillus sp. J11TS1]GIO25197.1 putative aminotransferase [Oceanobacillus sp. J11TS1]
MSELKQMDSSSLQHLHNKVKEELETIKKSNLSLNMSRGKPSAEQLKLSLGLLNSVNAENIGDNFSVLNYGLVDGIPEAKTLFKDILGVDTEEILIGGNASLNIMHDIISKALIKGVIDSETPWGKEDKIKFICPVPGYDRHFTICEAYDIEMISVDMLENGPDMDKVEELVRNDTSIKGIWCVPKYSNPDGITYSDDVVERLAKMETQAKDFKIFWDNAYAIHDLTENPPVLKNILEACKKHGNPNRVFMFASTSKVTFPGSGVAVVAASKENIQFIKTQLSVQTIGPDKVNQLRHVRFFKNYDNILEHMKKHAEIMKPKFDAVLNILHSKLGAYGIATWTEPQGGYFISLNTMDGCASEVISLAAEAGVTLTGAGAAFPYGKDPRDRNIRIAPSFPTLAEVEKAIEVLCLCIILVSTNKLL